MVETRDGVFVKVGSLIEPQNLYSSSKLRYIMIRSFILNVTKKVPMYIVFLCMFQYQIIMEKHTDIQNKNILIQTDYDQKLVKYDVCIKKEVEDNNECTQEELIDFGYNNDDYKNDNINFWYPNLLLIFIINQSYNLLIKIILFPVFLIEKQNV